MSLPLQGVMVVWECEWQDEDIDHVSETSSEGIAAINPDIESCSESESNDDNSSNEQMMHTVTFKCIGTTHHIDAQDVLCRVNQLLDQGENVNVDIFPEPDNPHDSNAITFKCLIDGEWKTIGYVVKEALDSVHSALNQMKIAQIKFSWVKYMVTWTRSGPGYYAGIDITIYGHWPAVVSSCASTR